MGKRVLGALAGEDLPLELLGAWAASADVLLAADRAADLLMEAGHLPHHLIGDLDSVLGSTLSRQIIVHKIPDQERSDADKLFEVAAVLGHQEITIAGIEGDLFDHMLGSLASAVRSGLEVRFALRKGIGVLVREKLLYNLPTAPGRRVSLFPLIPSSGVQLKGVEWPLIDAELSIGGQVSISNCTIGDEVSVEISSGVALMIAEYPRDEMPAW